MQFISESEHTTRKAFRCASCGHMVAAGERHAKQVNKDGGDFCSYRAHLGCMACEYAYHAEGSARSDDGFTPVCEMGEEDEPWMREKFPDVALRRFGPKGGQ